MKQCALPLLLWFLATHAFAAEPEARTLSAAQLANLSLEELLNIEVTSVSKKSESLLAAAAAIYVITDEDIRRSGVTTIAEALRMAPGLDVARITAHDWAISSRGFSDLFANKLLVLIDGRSVYTPLFAGVLWDVQDTMLEDIDRIEVIRGPGATLWGANAVNGVINITTKSSKLTQGTLITAGAGTEEQGFGAIRHGGKLSESATYRVYAKYFNRDDAALASGDDANDWWNGAQGGFRTDWEPNTANLLTLQGDVYSIRASQTYNLLTPTLPFSRVEPDVQDLYGANLIGRWTHTFSEDSDFRLQAYYDRTGRENSWFSETRDTYDIEAQYRFPLLERHDIIVGAGYRYSQSYDSVSNFNTWFTPAERDTHSFNTFVQDEITVVPDRLFLTLGSKFEHNSYSHWEFQPSGRLLWRPHEKHSLWSSVSRALRTPSQTDFDVHVTSVVIPPFTPGINPGPVPLVFALQGSEEYDSEELLAYELGYRAEPGDWITLDLALFYNDYDRLRTFEPGLLDISPLPLYVRQPFLFANNAYGETYGGELAANLKLTKWWMLRASYTYLQMQIHLEEDSLDASAEDIEGNSAHHKVHLRSLMDLPYNFQFDISGRYVDQLPAQNIDSYIAVDARIGYRPLKNLDFSIVVQNIFDDRHPERAASAIREQATEVERAVYGKVTWTF